MILDTVANICCGIPLDEVSNNKAILKGELPSSNGVSNAKSAAKIMSAMVKFNLK